jgi:hypothetical protein
LHQEQLCLNIIYIKNSEKSRRVAEMASGLWGRLYSFQHFPQLLMPQFSYIDAWM